MLIKVCGWLWIWQKQLGCATLVIPALRVVIPALRVVRQPEHLCGWQQHWNHQHRLIAHAMNIFKTVSFKTTPQTFVHTATENICIPAIAIKGKNEENGAYNFWSILNPTSHSTDYPVYSAYHQVGSRDTWKILVPTLCWIFMNRVPRAWGRDS